MNAGFRGSETDPVTSDSLSIGVATISQVIVLYNEESLDIVFNFFIYLFVIYSLFFAQIFG